MSEDIKAVANHGDARASAESHAAADDAKMSNAFVQGARDASSREQQMTLMQGIRLYPKAIGWSMLISTCIVMEGYDISLVSNFFAFDPFKKKYGELQADGTYEISAAWQAGLSNGVAVGEIIGLFLNGYISERFGYRWTVIGALMLLTGFITIFFTAQNIETLLVAEILCGLPWGVFQTLTITYAAEVCPIALRGHLTTYVNFCWGLGQLIGIGVITSMLDRTDEWSYRIPYALQWIWPVPIMIGVYFAPESPWWLIRKGRVDDAKHSLLRLTSKNTETDFDADDTVAMMVHTAALEEKITAGASYLDCFKGIDLRRTEIVCLVWAIQNLSGNSFSNYSRMMILWALVYQLTVGTVCYSLVSELPSRRLQIKTVVLGRNLYNVVGIINNVVTPYMLNPTAWNWQNKAGFFWAGLCFLCLVYTYFRVPEPRGRTFAELDVLFEHKVTARQFEKTKVNVFEEEVPARVSSSTTSRM
ncbi:General alpha-glucoside permease like protein [Verticillium longisporum]|uniref:General alpha-glucoside permease like protein n=1 Tax=Verticillium longisporum TaxID=100787 RepID=A0A8I3AEY9_VERLO|nr:General alpha-glucoside permease like protein [Verticillium longisporum]